MVAGGMRDCVTKTAAMTVIATALGATGVMSLNTDAMKPRYRARRSTSPSAVAANKQKSKSQTATKPKPIGQAPSPVMEAATSPELKRRASQLASAATGTLFSAQKQWRDTSIIRLGEPRSSEVKIEFDHGEKPVQKVLQAHCDNNRAYGSSSLIGELAQIVESYLVERKADLKSGLKNINRPPLKLCGITFKFGRNDDIVAHQCGTYNKIIEKMILSTSATPTSKPDASETAEKLPTRELDSSKAAETLADLKYSEEETNAPESAWPRRELNSLKAAEILVKFAHSELESPMLTSEFYSTEVEEKLTPESTALNPSIREKARKILENLSKPCEIPPDVTVEEDEYNGRKLKSFKFNELTLKHIQSLAEKLFEGLDDSSKNLVAVFLCECRRFKDDGALVRWSIRKFISDCGDQKIGTSPNKLKSNFDSKKAASFSKPGGKSAINEVINNAPEDLSQAGLNALRTLEGSKQCLSPVTTRLSDPLPQSTE